MTPTLIPPVDHHQSWLDAEEADDVLETLLSGLWWEQKTITMYGRSHAVPRLTCWLGDAPYVYSGVTNDPHPWTPELAALRDRLEGVTGTRFNSVLANLYRDGQDTVGWHADDEPELGDRPTIASVSLGAARTFRLRHRSTRESFDFELSHGDLLVMRDESQVDYRHALPRRARVTEPRVNLTFRRFVVES